MRTKSQDYRVLASLDWENARTTNSVHFGLIDARGRKDWLNGGITGFLGVGLLASDYLKRFGIQ